MAQTTISLYPDNGNQSVVSINCGSTSPKFGGSIYLDSFPNLSSFTCNFNDIVSIDGYKDNENLVFIDYSDNKVTTPIPSFTNLAKIKQYSCQNNLINGSPPDLTPVVSTLEAFRAWNNSLTGRIPPFTFSTKLSIYNVGDNSLSGSIPPLTGLPYARRLNLYENKFTGSIPAISGMRWLTEFNVFRNYLTGPIPSLSGCDSLEHFNCYENPTLSGSIPTLSALKNLTVFQCYSAALTGPIPSLDGLTKLTVFNSYSNGLSSGFAGLTGPIPTLSSLSSLEVFQSYYNDHTGAIPSLSGLNKLRLFHVYDNRLTGYLGTSVSPTLTNFQAHNNLLSSGTINQILATFVAASSLSGYLNLGGRQGTNEPPTGQGLTDRTTLRNRYWTVVLANTAL